jgi:hypothetical protein
MARTSGRLAARVLFVVPPGLDDRAPDSELRNRVAALPDVESSDDEGGLEAARFAAQTSGQAVVYDVSGERAFQGGITASRGHEGDNAGRSAIEAFVADDDSPHRTPVYGCALHDQRDIR